MCLRISGLNIANFSDKGAKLLTGAAFSHSLNTLLAVCFHFASSSHSFQVNNTYWAMLVFNLLVLLIAFQITYESSLQTYQHLKQQLSAAAQTCNFLVTERLFWNEMYLALNYDMLILHFEAINQSGS
jgi:hypothetical protein